MSGFNSIASEIAIKKLLFLGHLITEPNMAPTVRNLFKGRTESYFDMNITSVSEILCASEIRCVSICESWFNNSTFPTYKDWKRILRDKIQVFERDTWVSVLQLSFRYACCSDLFRKYVYPTILVDN